MASKEWDADHLAGIIQREGIAQNEASIRDWLFAVRDDDSLYPLVAQALGMKDGK